MQHIYKFCICRQKERILLLVVKYFSGQIRALVRVLISSCRYNQVNAIRMACSTGVTQCQTLTTVWFKQWMDNPQHNLSVDFTHHLIMTII